MLYIIMAAILALVVYIHVQQCQSKKEAFEGAKFPELLGKKLSIVSATSAAASTTDTFVMHVKNGTISKPPLVLTSKPSKFVGKSLENVLPTLQKRYGEKRVIAEPLSAPQSATLDLTKNIIIKVDASQIVRAVLIPSQWLQPDEMPARQELKSLVGVKPIVVVNANQVVTQDKDPKRLRVFVSKGVISRVPFLG